MKRADCLEYLASRVQEHWLGTTSLSVNTALWSRLRPGGANFMGLNMGLCTPFALGLALAFPRQKVIALDSDGSLMVDTSALITVADARPENLVVMVFDNESYARMGPTPTSRGVDLEKMAQGAGICRTWCVRTVDDFRAAADAALSQPGPAFVLAKVEHEPVRIHGTRKTYGQAMVQAFKDAMERHPEYPWKRDEERSGQP